MAVVVAVVGFVVFVVLVVWLGGWVWVVFILLEFVGLVLSVVAGWVLFLGFAGWALPVAVVLVGSAGDLVEYWGWVSVSVSVLVLGSVLVLVVL